MRIGNSKNSLRYFEFYHRYLYNCIQIKEKCFISISVIIPEIHACNNPSLTSKAEACKELYFPNMKYLMYFFIN